MIDFENDNVDQTPTARIKVLGVGGAGGNTINSMIDAEYSGVEFIAANTDAQALRASKAPLKLQLGSKSTKGLGAGANPELGKRAAEEDLETIEKYLSNADVVFLTGGLGGGTGSGALPVIARVLKEHNILTIAVITKPFDFEGKRRMNVADNALELLQKEVDTLIVIPNQKLLAVTDEHVSLINAFGMINNVVHQFVRSISDIITQPGHINVDFADVKAIMKDMGLAVMGTGRAKGVDRAQEAALEAITSPLLENMDIKGARGVLINITGNSRLGLHEVSAATSIIYEQAHKDASIILGAVIDESLGDEVSVTIIATGFEPVLATQPTMQIKPTTRDHAIQEIHVQEIKTEPICEAPKAVMAKQENPILINTDDIEVPTALRRMALDQQQQKN